MYKTKPLETVEDIIRDEFQTYYVPRAIWGRTDYMGPDEHAECSLERISKNVLSSTLPSLLALLNGMESDREHPLTKQIEIETGFNWTKEDSDWKWYTSLLSMIRAGLATSVGR